MLSALSKSTITVFSLSELSDGQTKNPVWAEANTELKANTPANKIFKLFYPEQLNLKN